MSAPTPREIIDQLYAAFSIGDVPGILALCSEQVQWDYYAPNPPVGVGGHREGKAGVLDFFVQVGAHEEIHEFVVDSIASEGTWVAVRGHERTTVKSTGKVFETPWIHWWTVEHGLITRYEGFYDSALVVGAYTP